MELEALYQFYSKEVVDKAIKKLTYKKTPPPLPKDEDDNYPTLYIFRHGQSDDNINMVFSGWRDAGITEEGKKQALVLAPKLKKIKFGMLISSTQKRAYETMKLAISQNKSAKNLEILRDERIRERNYGLLNGYSKLELYLWHKDLTKAYRRSYETIPPGGESIEMVCNRVANFCDEIVPLVKDAGFNVAISCHGNSIRGFRRYFEKLSDEDTANVETPLGQDYAAYTIR